MAAILEEESPGIRQFDGILFTAPKQQLHSLFFLCIIDISDNVISNVCQFSLSSSARITIRQEKRNLN